MYPVLYDMTLKDYDKMFVRRLQKNCSMLRIIVFKVWELMNIYIYADCLTRES